MLKLPESISQLKVDKTKKFKGMIQTMKSILPIVEDEDIGLSLYPSAEITGKSQDKITGEMEITVTKSNGQAQKVHSKLGGDGPFGAQSCEKALKKLVQFVEG